MLRKSCLYIYVIHVRPYDYVTKVFFALELNLRIKRFCVTITYDVIIKGIHYLNLPILTIHGG